MELEIMYFAGGTPKLPSASSTEHGVLKPDTFLGR